FGSRSATATPTGSPKKRQLPQTPLLKERMMTQDDERHRLMRYPHRLVHTTYRSTGIGGWERHYSGRSDSDLLSSIGHDPPSLPHAHRLHHRTRRGHLSPDKDVLGDFGDSDMESIISVASSAFSTQSERPRGSRALIPTVKNILVPSVISHLPLPPLFIRRTRRKHKIKQPISNIITTTNNNNNNNSITNKNKASNNNLNNKNNRISISKECNHYHPISYSIKTWKPPSNKYHNPATFISDTTIVNKPKTTTNTSTLTQNHLLVRSKSAVVRSMHRKPRVPIVRSQTVDDNLFRYNISPSNATSSTSNFIKDFCIEKPSNSADNICCYYDYDNGARNRPYFRYTSKYPNHDDFFVDLRGRSKVTQVPRRAKSVEYESVSSNIFSDDSLRTARRKVKRNLTVTGDKLPYMNDQSKSYYDSTGDSSKASESVVDSDQDFNNDLRVSYGVRYGSYSVYLDEHHDDNLDNDHQIDSIIDAVEASSEYERHLYKRRLDSQLSRAKSDDNHYGIDNEHIYCSIDSNPECHYASVNDYDSSRLGTKVPNNYCDKLVANDEYSRDSSDDRLRPARRTKSTDSYLEDSYDYHHGSYEDCRGRSRSFAGRTEREPFISFEAAYDEFAPQERKNVKVLEKAESSPTLHEDDQSMADWEVSQSRRLSRRRRNSSCPEARDIRNLESPLTEAVSMNFFMGSDDDFGSTETVVAPDYRKDSGKEESSGGKIRRNDDDRHREDRKTSCPECRDLWREHHYTVAYPDGRKSSRGSADGDWSREFCPDCPPERAKKPREGARDVGKSKKSDRRLAGDEREQSGSKRNVAISDTLEYYEYSMESESQCSENCGFGPYDLSLRPRNRAPRPGNANSNIFDSQTATSDTDKNHPRVNDRRYDTVPRRKRRDSSVNANDAANDDTGTSLKSGYKSTDHLSKSSVDSVRINSNDRTANPDNLPRKRSGDYNSPGGSYEKNTRHQVTGNGHNGHPKRGQFSRSLSNADGPPDEKVADGSLSDTAVGLHVEEAARRARKSSPGSKSGSGSSSGGGSAVQYQAGLGKKSNSTSQLSATGNHYYYLSFNFNYTFFNFYIYILFEGRKRRLGFGKKGKSSFTVHRSEEVLPEDTTSGRSGRQPSSASSDGEGSGDGDSWSPCLRSTGEGGQLSEFIDGLGPGQLVGRQVLGASSLGDIQLALNYTKGYLEVEVVRARDLQPKPGSKVLPAPYVKVYLVNGKKCIAKAKTTTARKTLEPFYQQPLAFRENFQGCILQVTVWGDYGRLEGRKVFMGVAQIMLDDLNLNEMVFGWYKLFGTTSLVSGPPSVVLSRRSSANSLDSLKL
ncbi:GSCOCG00010977001-RA-CDS, partial [Cotesia congregata]